MSGGDVWRLPSYQHSTIEQRAAMVEWARRNGLDPSRVIGDGLMVDMDARVIRYGEYVDEDTPGAWRPSPYAPWRRSATAPLLVGPPPAVFGRPASRLPRTAAEQLAANVVHSAAVWRSSGDTADGHRRAEAALIAAVDAYRQARAGVSVSQPTPAAVYDWARYERTCDPDRQLDGLGDLCLFLGGSWSETPGASSFTGELLKLIAKADPTRLAALEAGFPREVRAWLVWMSMSPSPTAAELCARLVDDDNKRRVLLNLAAELVDRGDGWHVSPCKTPACRRLPVPGLLICCIPCRSAPDGTHGPHTGWCDRRHIERAGTEEVKAGE